MVLLCTISGGRPAPRLMLLNAQEVAFVKIEIRKVEDIKATAIHQVAGAGGA